MSDTPDAESVAQQATSAMFEADQASQALGMKIEAVGPGWADVSMTVRQDMLNGHGTCHGGLLFTLADSAFGFGCNAYNQVTVAQSCEITFLIPGRLDDVLTAQCRERALAGRSGVYDVEILNQTGATVALFRGKSRRIPGEVVEGLTLTDAPS